MSEPIPSLYQPLIAGDNIRVAELEPGQDGDPLVCTLRMQSIQELPYAAISYVWGNPAKEVTITCNGLRLRITSSLGAALGAFRLENKVRRLWADGICINQDDAAEREAQVSLMGIVYETAQVVLGWIGPDPGTGAIVIDFIRSFHNSTKEYIETARTNLSASQNQPTNSDFRTNWMAVKDLFDRPFFHRVWIIQELGLSKQALLWYGKHSIEWSMVAHVVFTLDNEATFIVNHFQLKSWIVNHTYLTWQKFNGQPRYSFSEVLHWARVHQCTDDRDRIFAFLGHPSAMIDGSLILQPNYSPSYTHLDAYIDVARNIIRRTGALRILSFVDHDEEPSSNNLPTWVPAWNTENKVMFLGYPTAAAPLVDKKYISTVCIGPHVILNIRGFVVDEISKLSNILSSREFVLTTLEEENQKSTPFLLDHLWCIVEENCVSDRNADQVLETLGLALAPDWVFGKHATQNLSQHHKDFAAYAYESVHRLGHSKL